MLTRAQFNVIFIVVQILVLGSKITISSGASHSCFVTCQISQLLISFIFHLISGYSSTIQFRFQHCRSNGSGMVSKVICHYPFVLHLGQLSSQENNENFVSLLVSTINPPLLIKISIQTSEKRRGTTKTSPYIS